MTSALAATVTAFALFAASCSNAQSAEQAKTPELSSNVKLEAVASAAAWNIQADNSHIQFSAKQEGESFTGGFTEFSGTINFDPDTPKTGSVDISIPLKSVDAGSRDRNSTLPGKVWFSVKKFPEARFISTDISKQDTGFLAKGELTLKGTSLPIELPFDLEINGNRAVMTGQVTLDRTLWNVGAAPWDTDEWVSRDVTLDLKVTADRVE